MLGLSCFAWLLLPQGSLSTSLQRCPPARRGAGADGGSQGSQYSALPFIGWSASSLPPGARRRRCWWRATELPVLCPLLYRASCSLTAARRAAAQVLVEGHMLTAAEEAELRASLRFRPQDRWLKLLYRRAARRAAPGDGLQPSALLLPGCEACSLLLSHHDAALTALFPLESAGLHNRQQGGFGRGRPARMRTAGSPARRRAKCKKHEQQATMEATLDALEAPAQPAGAATPGGGVPAQQTPVQPGAGARPHSAQVRGTPPLPPASGGPGAAQQGAVRGCRTCEPVGGARRLTLWLATAWSWRPARAARSSRARCCETRLAAAAQDSDGVRTRSMATRASTSGERGGSAGGARGSGGGAESRAQPADTVRPRTAGPGLRSCAPRPRPNAAPQPRAHVPVEPHHHTHAALGAARLPRDPPPPLPRAAPSCTGARRRAGHGGRRGERRAGEAGLRPGRQPGRGRLPRRVVAAPGRLPGGPSLSLTRTPPGRLSGGSSRSGAPVDSAPAGHQRTIFSLALRPTASVQRPVQPGPRSSARRPQGASAARRLARPASPDRSRGRQTTLGPRSLWEWPHGCLSPGARLSSCRAIWARSARARARGGAAPGRGARERARAAYAGGVRADVGAAGRQPVRAGGHARAPHRRARAAQEERALPARPPARRPPYPTLP
jgi:hypothetical protein